MHLANVFQARLVRKPSCAHSGQTIPFSLLPIPGPPSVSFFGLSVEPLRFSSLVGLSVEDAMGVSSLSRSKAYQERYVCKLCFCDECMGFEHGV